MLIRTMSMFWTVSAAVTVSPPISATRLIPPSADRPARLDTASITSMTRTTSPKAVYSLVPMVRRITASVHAQLQRPRRRQEQEKCSV